MKKTITTIAFGLLCISLSAQTPSYVPTNGLVGWWPFSGNASDESGNGNNGTVNGATLTIDRFGNANKAYDFNGSNNFIEGSCNNFPQDSLTVSVWFYSNNISITPSTFNGILGYGGGNGSYPANCGKSFNMWFNNPGTSSNNAFEIQQHCNINVVTYPYGSNNPNGNWHNWIVTCKTGETKFYLDGGLVYASTTSPSNNIIISGKKFIYGAGVNLDGLTNYSSAQWTGKLDDIGIWNRALTQQEISNLYNGNICYQNITVTDTLLINTSITGFNPVTYKNTIKVWPNPTNDHITIDNGNIANLTGYQIKITNSLSQQVFQSAITQQQFYVDLSTWTGNGIYFVHIIDGQGNTIDIKKIVLQ